jgi:hypothetical protein
MIKMTTGQCGRLWRLKYRRVHLKDLYHPLLTVNTDPVADADEVDDIFLEVGYQRHSQNSNGYRCLDKNKNSCQGFNRVRALKSMRPAAPVYQLHPPLPS